MKIFRLAILMFLITHPLSMFGFAQHFNLFRDQGVKECLSQQKYQPDTLSFEHFLQLTENYSEIPECIIDKFLGRDWIDNEDPYRYFSGDRFSPFKKGDVTYVVVSITHYGICSNQILFSFDSNAKLISSLEVGEVCDHDLNVLIYTSKGYILLSKEVIVTIDSKSEAMNEEGEDFDFSQSETNEFESYTFYNILNDGTFSRSGITGYFQINPNEPNLTKELLNKESLKDYSKKDLRIMRNEIFARKGYIFKSPDLRKHFKRYEWYKPISNDVTEQLNLVELYNIKLIKGIEDSKTSD